MTLRCAALLASAAAFLAPGGFAQTNLALNKTASQSSSMVPAARAVDGNTDGNWVNNSVTHTDQNPNEWWQVDLGGSAIIGSVVIWNRTDCCMARLNDYWVFISNTPFGDTDTPATLQARTGTWSSHQTAYPNPSTTISAGGALGRYVRVQLSGANFLSLAEVQVFGTMGSPPSNVSVSPASGSGASQMFAFTSSSPSGGANVLWMEGLINSYNHPDHGCFMGFWPGSQTVGLADDNGSTWPLMGTLGSSTVLQNSQCRVTLAASSVGVSGNNVTVNVAVTFLSGLSGPQQTWMLTGDYAGLASAWQQMGAWNVAVTLQAPVNVSVSPASGAGVTQTFDFTSSSVNGYSQIAWQQIIFNYALNGSGACYFYYSPASNTIYINADSGGWLQNVVLGTAGTVENSQCRLNVGASSFLKSFNTGTLRLSLTFKAGMPGTQNVYLSTGDNAGLVAPWLQVGAWTTTSVSSEPAALVSVTPSAGTGLSQMFDYLVSSVNGADYIMQVHTIIGNAVSDAGVCYVYLDRASNYLGLLSDTGWAGGVQTGAPGSPGTLSNSQCQLDTGASSVTKSGNNLTLHLRLTFSASWAGARNNYMLAWDRGQIVNWSQKGAWTVGAAPLPPTTVSVSPSSGTGLSQVFTATFQDTSGFGDITSAQLLIQSTLTGVAACRSNGTGTATPSCCSMIPQPVGYRPPAVRQPTVSAR